MGRHEGRGMQREVEGEEKLGTIFFQVAFCPPSRLSHLFFFTCICTCISSVGTTIPLMSRDGIKFSKRCPMPILSRNIVSSSISHQSSVSQRQMVQRDPFGNVVTITEEVWGHGALEQAVLAIAGLLSLVAGGGNADNIIPHNPA